LQEGSTADSGEQQVEKRVSAASLAMRGRKRRGKKTPHLVLRLPRRFHDLLRKKKNGREQKREGGRNVLSERKKKEKKELPRGELLI